MNLNTYKLYYTREYFSKGVVFFRKTLGFPNGLTISIKKLNGIKYYTYLNILNLGIVILISIMEVLCVYRNFILKNCDFRHFWLFYTNAITKMQNSWDLKKTNYRYLMARRTYRAAEICASNRRGSPDNQCYTGPISIYPIR